MRVHGKFHLRFGIELGAWRDSGIEDLWNELKENCRSAKRKLKEESRTADRAADAQDHGRVEGCAVRLRLVRPLADRLPLPVDPWSTS